jgi:polyisoprenoid-binding protein YceI
MSLKDKIRPMPPRLSHFFSVGAVIIFSLVLIAEATLLSAQAAPSHTSEIVLTLDPTQSNLHWKVDSTLHMVHGTFALKSGTMQLNAETGDASGEIAVSAQSGESGNGSRDKRMHKEILETAKYPDITFHPHHFEGKVSVGGISDGKLSGVLSIHGADHDVTALVHAELKGDHWTGTSTFEVPYVQWGIKDPSNFMLKVKRVVTVELEMSGQATTK